MLSVQAISERLFGHFLDDAGKRVLELGWLGESGIELLAWRENSACAILHQDPKDPRVTVNVHELVGSIGLNLVEERSRQTDTEDGVLVQVLDEILEGHEISPIPHRKVDLGQLMRLQGSKHTFEDNLTIRLSKVTFKDADGQSVPDTLSGAPDTATEVTPAGVHMHVTSWIHLPRNRVSRVFPSDEKHLDGGIPSTIVLVVTGVCDKHFRGHG